MIFLKRIVEIRYFEEEWFVERLDGSISIALTPRDALNLVNKDNKLLVKKKKLEGLVTSVTWINVPIGFSAPGEKK